MQKSPPTPSATSWSSRAAAAPSVVAQTWRDAWLCAGESTPGSGSDSDTGTHPALRALGQTDLTIYIVEDSEAVKERLIESVEDIPHARVVGSADGVAAALEGMRTVQPRVLILDIQLRGGSGFRLLKLMRAAGLTRPETIITSACRGEARNVSAPNLERSLRTETVFIISIAQHARPNVAGQRLLFRAQLTTASSLTVTTSGSDSNT